MSAQNEDPVGSTGETPNLTSSHRQMLGISSGKEWFMRALSRQPCHLLWRGEANISSAVAQALKRKNVLDIRENSNEDSLPTGLEIASIAQIESTEWRGEPKELQHETADKNAVGSISTSSCMKQYHATVHSEEETATYESLTSISPVPRHSDDTSCALTALITYNPPPVVKLSEHDLVRTVHQQASKSTAEGSLAVLIFTLAVLAQCRLNLLKKIEKLERDIPIPSVELCETKNFATPKTSLRPDRMRSLSGSTVADVFPPEEALSFSAISTVHSVDNRAKEVRWAEKRVTEEHDAGFPPKRPKLTDYKQVSAGRVAMLMDRFEKFHI